jgi:non-ribosomal peptide synthetase component F/acyl carrier protein
MSRPSPVTTPAEPVDRAAEAPHDLDPGRSLPPRTPYEDAIASVLGDVLGCSDIDVQDRLLALGDVSQAPRVVAHIRRTMGVDIPVADYVEAQTVAGLSAAVAAKSLAARSAFRPPSLGPRPGDARAVLSFDQQRLWMENQLLPGSIYNVHGRRRIVGQLDVAVIEASIRTIIARHETLRTRFPATDDDPVQVVDDPDEEWRIPVADLTGLRGHDNHDAVDHGADTVMREARRLLDEELTRPFDLTAGPLIRCLLIKLRENEHALGVTMHHIVSDAWSIGLFVRELTALYEAGGDPRRAGLAPLPVQYRDYAVWQRGWLSGDALEFQVGHWARHLRGGPRALALPTVQRRTNAMRAEAGQVVAELSPGETAALHELCRTHAVTSFMVLYAVLATVFSRWSGQTDIVVGVPVAGRTNRVTDRLIGFFVNMLPLRIDLSDNPTFAGLVERVRRVAVDGYAHAEAPMDELVRELGVVRDPRRTPLFEVVLNVVASPEVENVTRLSIEQMDTPSLFSRYDLTLTAQESGGVLTFKLDFPADRFDPPAGRVLLQQLRTLLRAAVADPTVRLLDEPAGEPALTSSDAPVEPAAPSTPHHGIARHAADPDLIAVVDGDGRHSYRWLSLATERVAECLVRHGVTAADRVGVVRRPNAAFVAALAGAAKVGVPGTVVETDDPALTGPLGLTTVLDPRPAGPPAAHTIDLSTVLPAEADTTAAVGSDAVVTPDWAAERFGFGRADRFVVLTSRPGHLMSAMGSAFGAGATLVIPDRAFGDDVDALTAWLNENAITVAYLEPSILRALSLPRAQSTRPPAAGLPALRCVVIDNAGDLLPRDIVAMREVSPGCRCVAVYRVAADGRPLAFSDVAADLDPETAPVRVRLGTPLPGSAIALRRPSGEAAAIGELAEIWNGSDRTGDLGRAWPDGCLEYVGQSGADPTNDAVDTVSVLRDVPGVRDAVVTEHADDDGTTALLGYVAGPDPELDTIAIQQYLKARLPDYLVPRHVFVLDRLPRTPWGGYDLRALPRPARDGSDGDTYAAPRTPMEAKLTAILEELLDTKRVGIYDSFFELGGFSMLATRLITRIRDAFGVLLAVRDVFESPTVDELARLIVRTQVEQAGIDDVEALLAEIEDRSVTTPETT